MTRADLKGKVSLLSRDARHDGRSCSCSTGADPEDFTDDEWDERPRAAGGGTSAPGQVRRFTGNDYIRDLNAGNIVACEAWSGDVIAMQYDNPDIKWVVPEEGLSLWSRQHAGAEQGRPQGQRRGADELLLRARGRGRRWRPGSTTSARSTGAQEAMEKIDPSLVDNPLIFPDEDVPRQRLRRSWSSTRRRGSVRQGLRAGHRGLDADGRHDLDARRRSPSGSARSPRSTTST